MEIVAARFEGRDMAAMAAGLKQAEVMVSLRQDFIRFSPHLYNGSDDIGAALEAIDGVLGAV